MVRPTQRKVLHMANNVHIISGKAHWASVLAPNTTYEPVYSIDLELDDDTKSTVEGLGLTIKNKGDDRNDFVTIKRKLYKKNGDERPAPGTRAGGCPDVRRVAHVMGCA